MNEKNPEYVKKQLAGLAQKTPSKDRKKRYEAMLGRWVDPNPDEFAKMPKAKQIKRLKYEIEDIALAILHADQATKDELMALKREVMAQLEGIEMDESDSDIKCLQRALCGMKHISIGHSNIQRHRTWTSLA